MSNKRKIINDPVHGFISIPSDLIFDLIQHPYFQRLRRIKQLGLTHLVYPGALHTRFQHALGAMHLMMSAINSLKSKGADISKNQAESAYTAILLHDIGHGPFSHVLENTIIRDVSHEQISRLIMERLNSEMNNELADAISIFEGKYSPAFFHQLVSGQLDMDRLDYLRRDSFYSGVSEGIIGSERIIKMLNVIDDNLVVEAKGVYSIEKFLVARRFMYWQVYLHKTALAAEKMLINILKRARELVLDGNMLFAPPQLSFFLKNDIKYSNFTSSPETLDNFMMLDDDDIMSAIKIWAGSDDLILSLLSRDFISRNLFGIKLSNEPFDENETDRIKDKVIKHYRLKDEKLSN
ncbi:MAG: HD domain-containing protein, partial [Chlorobi bacterium]|nr:HD domain-containing protein [Chlorobiota bacterium]